MNNLLPCPFCGGEAEFECLGTSRCSSIVACQNCGCRVEANEVGEFNGDHWNRRLGVVKMTKDPLVTFTDAIYDKWVMKPQEEIAYLKEQLKLACQYLAEGKRKFAPNTTNSDVDFFLERHSGLQCPAGLHE